MSDGKQLFMAYGNGKRAIRLGASVRADGPHESKAYAGELFDPDAEDVAIQRYPAPTFDRWVAKYMHYGDFSDF